MTSPTTEPRSPHLGAAASPPGGDRAASDAATGSRAHDRGRRVAVTDPVATARPYHYADAFELRLDGPDPCAPEEWLRMGVDATPRWIKLLAGHGDGLGSARIVRSDADVVVLEDSDALMDTVLVARSLEDGRRVLTTVLRYHRPGLARAMWSVVGPLHRRTARRLITAGLPRSSTAALPGDR